MYSVNTAMKTSGASFISAGINDNVTVKEVNVNKSPTGLDFLEIVFEKDGNTVSMSEWKNTKGTWIKTDEDLQRRDNQQFGRILQVLDCFYSEIEDVSFDTFKDMINWAKTKLDAVISTKKPLRAKFVYDNRGYVTLSRNGIFVEAMDTQNSQIEIMSRDKMTRPEIKADVETSDPLAVTNSTPVPENLDHGTNVDDLPF